MVDILLATYNGEKYIGEQIDSILAQSYQDFRILIRDDGSVDSTLSIVKEYQSKYPDKIVLVEDQVRCGCSTANFLELTKHARSDYVMYCDQDDYWLPDKIQISLQYMHEEESLIGADKPILVYPRYIVADENLNRIDKANVSSQIEKDNVSLNQLLVQNCVTGCLMMCNKALYSLLGDYDEAILMHDWWAAIIAAAMGAVVPVDAKVMLYRQHGNNVVGSVDVKSFRYRWTKLTNPDTAQAKYKYRDQAKACLDRYREILPYSAKHTLQSFLQIYAESSKIHRMHLLVRGGFLKSDLVRRIGQLWYI